MEMPRGNKCQFSESVRKNSGRQIRPISGFAGSKNEVAFVVAARLTPIIRRDGRGVGLFKSENLEQFCINLVTRHCIGKGCWKNLLSH